MSLNTFRADAQTRPQQDLAISTRIVFADWEKACRTYRIELLLEPISKRLKSGTPAKADIRKRTENTG
jgi:hypothetical protein